MNPSATITPKVGKASRAPVAHDEFSADDASAVSDDYKGFLVKSI
jgi:hypothetical protein